MNLDRDLQSIQEVRNLVAGAKAASEILAGYSQQQLDAICEAVVGACMRNGEKLAKMAASETGYGRWEDKVLKNRLGSQITWEYVKDMKTVGLLREDPVRKIYEIGVPMGVVAALIPSTNPTSTVMYKSIISLKAGNAIVISPHPGAKNAILETARIIAEAAEAAGAPKGAVSCVSLTTVQATDTLLKHPDVSIILATGGEAMVHAAYSSGNPALGVGPGNGPSYIEHTADIRESIRQIFDSKTFDNGVICASEQSIVTEACINSQVEAEILRQGGYFMTEEQSAKLSGFLLRANGTMNPKIVGKTAEAIAKMADIAIPAGTRVLISRQDPANVNKQNPYAREKLCPILAYFVVNNWEEACDLSIRILRNEGSGHTMTLHTKNKEVVKEFGLKKPVSRILVNTPGALGGVGATTGLAPALTLGCGAVGGSATSDNVTPLNLINIRRVAYGLCELSDLRKGMPVPEGSGYSGTGSFAGAEASYGAGGGDLTAEEIEAITRAVIAKIRAKKSGF